jgi:hypothetical protein
MVKSGSPAPRIVFVQSKICCSSSAGTPNMSQMVWSGRGAANDSTKSIDAPPAFFSLAVATSCLARIFTDASIVATVFGVKPFWTSIRNFAWRGLSMTIIEPKNSSVSGGCSPKVMPDADENRSAFRLTSLMSS